MMFKSHLIKQILTDLIAPLPVVLLAIAMLLIEISADRLPPLSGVAAFKMDMARYEAVWPMMDGQKD